MQESPIGDKQRLRGLGLVKVVWNTPGIRLHLLALILVITGAVLALSDNSWTPTLISFVGAAVGYVGYFRMKRYFEEQHRLEGKME